jgi:NAD(P)H-flavin reductase
MAAIEASQGRPGADLYRPRLVRVLDVQVETPERGGTKLVATLGLERQGLAFRPGQFLEVGVSGGGEVPISISSPPGLEDTLLITVRAAGLVTDRLARSRPGAVVGLRGPCGNGFPLESYAGQDLLFIAGGIGLAPLRGLLWEALLQRERYGRIVVLHGARAPQDLLYPWQYAAWQQQGVEIWLSADHGDGHWEKGDDPPRMVGLITTWFPRLLLDPARTVALLCGPPVMIKVACSELTRRLGMAPRRCVATLERHMKCGVGKCGHCVVVDRYVCVDGPVFRYDELLALERIEPPW